jgi:exodeoxyribonuclease-3
VHLDLAPGDLPDMACGVNGQAFVQQLRPTYVTAEWVSGVLKEVRIWGPRVLRDGSLGKRELDHVWKRAVAEGGVNFRDLPPAVAAQLQSHIAKNDFTASQ